MELKKTFFDDDWKIWIWTNVSRGCSKDGIFKILLDNGFEFYAIKHELSYAPSTDVEQIVNPLLAQT
jgi:prolyl 4-hydroxylase